MCLRGGGGGRHGAAAPGFEYLNSGTEITGRCIFPLAGEKASIRFRFDAVWL